MVSEAPPRRPPAPAARYLLVVLDLVLQDDPVGLLGLLPQQRHAGLPGALLPDGHHLRRGWGAAAGGWGALPGPFSPSPPPRILAADHPFPDPGSQRPCLHRTARDCVSPGSAQPARVGDARWASSGQAWLQWMLWISPT